MDIRLLKEFRKEARDNIYIKHLQNGYYKIMERDECGRDRQRYFGYYEPTGTLIYERKQYIRELIEVTRALRDGTPYEPKS
jgi:hypothetical protein